MDAQREETARERERKRAACKHEEAVLERDVSNHIQNRLLAQLEVLRRSQSSHDHVSGGSQDDQSSPRLSNSTCIKTSHKRDQSYAPGDSEHSESSESARP